MNNKPILLSVPYMGGNEKKYVNECMDSEWISTSGSHVSDFENSIADYVKSEGAVACVNGTAALHISLLLAGVKRDEEVIVPTLTFIAPINVVKYLHAEPVFMDCDEFLNMDMEKLGQFLAEECQEKDGLLYNRSSGRRIAAIMPIHVFGSICDMEMLMALAEKYNLQVVEDATEALGSQIIAGKYAGKYAGTIGDYGCFSFNGNKIITCGGGGMMVAKEAKHIKEAKYLTTQAKDDTFYYLHNEVGYNYRLTAVQAAIGLGQMEQLDSFIEKKEKRYKQYKAIIDTVPGLSLMPIPEYCKSNYWFYSLFVDSSYALDKEELFKMFAENNIQVRPIWHLNHSQKPYENCQAYKIEKAEYYFKHIVNIPCSVSLTDEELVRVCDVLKIK